MILAKRASKGISWIQLQKGTLPLVQAFVLLAIYLQKRNRPNSGFTLLGIAANMAQGIGLHREFSGSSVNPFTMEIRRRVWWTMCVFDSEFRLTFGRPTLLLGGINTGMPSNLNDNDLAVDIETLPVPREVPTTASSLIWQIKLARIGDQANKRLVAKHIPDQAIMLALGQQVLQWATSLPKYMQADHEDPAYAFYASTKMNLLWRSYHLRIVIHRPFLLATIRNRVPLDFTDVSTPSYGCLIAAEECVTSILVFLGSGTTFDRWFLWFASYWLITAVFVHVTCLLYDPLHEQAPGWRQKIQDAKDTLEYVGTTEATAARASQILDKVIGKIGSICGIFQSNIVSRTCTNYPRFNYGFVQ